MDDEPGSLGEPEMQLTYSRGSTAKTALLFAVGGRIAPVFTNWPLNRVDNIVARTIFALGGLSAFYAGSFFVRLRAGGPALSAEVNGLRINSGRGARNFAWRDIASIERGVHDVSHARAASVPIIEIVLRAPRNSLWSWPGARPIKIPVGMIAQGEAAIDRWIDHAQRRLGAGAPAYGLVPSAA
jgi:hypothetical protein